MQRPITDEAVEAEIERLKNSEAVKLAKAEERERNRRKQYMYCLRTYERRGKELMKQGYTLDDFERSDATDGETV